MVTCADAVTSCDVASVAADIAAKSLLLHRQFRNCPSGCYFIQAYCDDFFTAINASLDALATGCKARSDFGLSCERMMRERDKRMADERFELGVMCSVISPGANFHRTPPCRSVVSATVAAYPTLSDCPQKPKQECVDHFCTLMAQFRWRIRPRNLQNPKADNKYPASYVLPGCEAVERHLFDNSSCHSRLDVHAFCDCLCGAVPAVQGPSAAECSTDADEYFLFGRLGVQDVRISPWCANEVCDVLNSQRSSRGCAGLQIPAERECRAMHLPYVRNGDACPWLQDSGQDHVLECMDGQRCSVSIDGWDCCEPHRGRGRCPRDAPVMCDHLCGSEGEYCCRPPGQCTPRECSPVFSAEPVYQATTTTSTTTLPPPGRGAIDEPSGGLNIRLPRGWWVWLLLLVPLVVGIAIVGLWFKTRRPRTLENEGVMRANMSYDYDGDGGFKRVRPSEDKKQGRSRPVVAIDMPELPETRPLGLELVETKVIRLFPWGQKCGFKVGDVIINIAGVAVSTFEEIWERIQVERDRPPVRFVVERHGALPEDLQEAVAPGTPPGTDGRSAVAQAPRAAEVREATKLREAAKEAWPPPLLPGPPSSQPLDSPHSSSGPADSEAIVLPEEEEVFDWRPRRQVQRLPPPVYQKSRFESVFEKEPRDKLQEIVDRHGPNGTPHEVRWVRDAWGRSVVQNTQ